MPIPVALDALAEELGTLPDEGSLYLNRDTGESLLVLDRDLCIVEEGREDEDGFEWDWDDEGLLKLEEIVTTTRWVRLPAKYEIHEWRIMQRFALHTPEPLSSSLDRVIHGRGAFRAFKSVLHGTGQTEDWYQFRHDYLARLVAQVLESEKIPFVGGAG